MKPGDSDSSSEGEGDSEEEAAPTARRRPRGGGAKHARTAGKAAAAPTTAAKLYVPAAPAEPRTRADMLSLLFACPALIGGCCMRCRVHPAFLHSVGHSASNGAFMREYNSSLSSPCPTDALLEPDGLRTISLVARDAAALAAALGARTQEMAQLWHQLALRCDPAVSPGATTEEGKRSWGEGWALVRAKMWAAGRECSPHPPASALMTRRPATLLGSMSGAQL